MRITRFVAVIGLFAAGVTATVVHATDVVYVQAAHLIVDASQPPLTPGAMVITDGIVTTVGAHVPVPAGARQLDLGPLTVMPSLLDAHAHLPSRRPSAQPGQPPPLVTAAYVALQGQKSVASALSMGVSAIRVLGTDDFEDVGIKNAIDDDIIPGPHVIPAANPLSSVGGHNDFVTLPHMFDVPDLYTPLRGFVASPADAEKAVQLQIKFGARVIKLMASGGVGSPIDSPLDEQLTLDEMRAAVQQAHMHHLKVAAHAQNRPAIMDAMRAGVDSIEHGSELNQEAVDYMKRHNIVLVPTVRVATTFANQTSPPVPGGYVPSPYSRFKATLLTSKHPASFALAVKNGVTIAAGSDNSYGPGSSGVFAEVVSEVEHGMSPRQALVTATVNGAALLGLDMIGKLTPGMEADFIAVEGDPFADIHAIEKVRMVVFKGKVLSNTTNGS